MRILGGTFKGRVLAAPPGLVTRPITAMVKKSLFDILGGRLDDAAVADLYCGGGTLGLEAVSRGARRCYFAECQRGAIRTLQKNIGSLGVADRCILWAGDLAARLAGWLAGTDAPLDVAFVDPPYAHSRQWSWAWAQERIFDPLAGRLAGGGMVVLRLPSKVQPPECLGRLAVERTKQYGDMLVTLLGLSPDTAADGQAGSGGIEDAQ